MKSIRQYLEENVKKYSFRLRCLDKIPDELMDRLELSLKKYDIESMSNGKKTIIHRPRGFGDVGPREVFTYDFSIKVPATTANLRDDIAQILGRSLDEVILNNMIDEKELWDEDDKDVKNKKYKSILADDSYSEDEKVDNKKYHGDGFIKKFLKDREKDKDKHIEEFK